VLKCYFQPIKKLANWEGLLYVHDFNLKIHRIFKFESNSVWKIPQELANRWHSKAYLRRKLVCTGTLPRILECRVKTGVRLPVVNRN
jgi:hypothetical protein